MWFLSLLYIWHVNSKSPPASPVHCSVFDHFPPASPVHCSVFDHLQYAIKNWTVHRTRLCTCTLHIKTALSVTARWVYHSLVPRPFYHPVYCRQSQTGCWKEWGYDIPTWPFCRKQPYLHMTVHAATYSLSLPIPTTNLILIGHTCIWKCGKSGTPQDCEAKKIYLSLPLYCWSLKVGLEM